MSVTVREATPEDWAAIQPFCHRILCEQETYHWDPGADADTERDFWMGPASKRVTVAVDEDGVVLGSAKMGPNRPGNGAHVATASFMVDPTRSGRGVGRALGQDMVEWARRAGYASIQFNAVVETNTRAVELWKRLGFSVIGTVPEVFDSPTHGRVGVHVMWQRL